MSNNITYTLTNRDGELTLSVFGPDFEKALPGNHPFFPTLVAYLTGTTEHDVDYVRDLVDPTRYIGKQMAEITPDLTYDMFHLYYQGIKVNGALAETIKQRIGSQDSDWKRLAHFLVRLEQNPSKRAKESVWAWVEKHGVSITEDGLVVGYKGLINGQDPVTGEQDVPVSVHSGPNNFIDGVLYGETDVSYQVPHRLGATISKRRADVDDSPKLACSTGLHVGAYSYAKTFGENRKDGARYSTMGRMADSLPNSTFALVTFSPANVVSVPEDGASDWKIRVTAYTVMEFLDEVKDLLKDMPDYNVDTPAPYIPESEKAFQEEQPETATYQEPEPEGDYQVESPEDLGADGDRGVDSEEPAGEDAQPEVTEPDTGVVTLVTPEHGSGLLGRLALRDWAAVNPTLAADLADLSQGHKAVARKYSEITTESSVRRFRKHG